MKELKDAHEKLTHASHKLAEVLYKANAGRCAERTNQCRGAAELPSRRKTKV